MNDLDILLADIGVLCLGVSYLLIVEADFVIAHYQINDVEAESFEKNCEQSYNECCELMSSVVNCQLPEQSKERVINCLNDIAQALFQLPDLYADLIALTDCDCSQIAESEITDNKPLIHQAVFRQLAVPSGEVWSELVTQFHIDQHRQIINERLVVLNSILDKYSRLHQV